MITTDFLMKEETIVTIGDYSLKCPEGKRRFYAFVTFDDFSTVHWTNIFASNRSAHSNKSWNASLIVPNSFIQSLYTNRKIEPLIDNKGSHIGSLFLSFPRSAVRFTFVENLFLW